jgi:hypothetical protein
MVAAAVVGQCQHLLDVLIRLTACPCGRRRLAQRAQLMSTLAPPAVPAPALRWAPSPGSGHGRRGAHAGAAD